jgi:hypothetical protein
MSDGPDKTDELYPIAVLIDELKVLSQLFRVTGDVHLLIPHAA